MNARSLPALLAWAIASALLLSLGFLAWVYLASLIAASRVDEGSVRSMQVALVVYARLVLVKGLLPQLVLTLALWAGLERAPALAAFAARGWPARAAGIGACAAAASVVVASTLMRFDLPGLPAVVYRDAWNFVMTCLEMTAAVTAAALVARLVLFRETRRAPGP